MAYEGRNQTLNKTTEKVTLIYKVDITFVFELP